MKKAIVIFLILFSFLAVKSQTNTCTPTYTPDTIFYPNTIYDYTNTANFWECLYLCGVNTVVYDTAHPSNRIVYINSGCTYVTNSGNGPYADMIYVKNNATLIIKANANSGSFRVFHEPLATVINLTSGIGTMDFTCTALSFPTVNCISTGIKSLKDTRHEINLYPNPSNGILNIEYEILNDDDVSIQLLNALGQILVDEKMISQHSSFNIQHFNSGMYFVKIIQSDKLIATQKFIKE